MTDHPTRSHRAELHELAARIPHPEPSTPARCDVCQSEPALVTLGAVDYCARCAPDPGEAVAEDLDDESAAA